MRAVGYVRVSTEDQAQAGVSLDAQEENLRALVIGGGGRDRIDLKTNTLFC